MLVSFLLTSLGFVFVHRISESALAKIGFSNHHTRLFAIFVTFMLTFFLMMADRPLLLWFFFGTFFILIKCLPQIFSQYLELLIQRQSLRVLDHLILNVQSGQSLRASLQAVSTGESSLLRIPLKNLVHAIIYENSAVNLKSPALKKLFEELVRIERSQAKCADQLRALRKQMKTLQDFRRRSGQVTMQIRMQAAISALLYVALLLFMITQFGFWANRGVILTSAGLFSTGLVTVFVIGRRNQWKT